MHMNDVLKEMVNDLVALQAFVLDQMILSSKEETDAAVNEAMEIINDTNES